MDTLWAVRRTACAPRAAKQIKDFRCGDQLLRPGMDQEGLLTCKVGFRQGMVGHSARLLVPAPLLSGNFPLGMSSLQGLQQPSYLMEQPRCGKHSERKESVRVYHLLHPVFCCTFAVLCMYPNEAGNTLWEPAGMKQ
jgi:hypothetical protein